MIRPYATGWQSTMIDLSLILFLVTAAALTTAGPGTAGAAPPRPSQLTAPPALAALDNASAVYRAGISAPPVSQWLAEQTPDPRQRLTILSLYRPGDEAGAAAGALRLLRDVGKGAPAVRIVMEPAEETQLLALLGYDMDASRVARSLREPVQSRIPVGGKP